MRELIKLWWTAPPDRQWLIDFFASRNLGTAVRVFVGVSVVVMGVVPAVALGSWWEGLGSVERGILLVLSVGAVAAGVCWIAIGWPTDRGSAVVLAWGDAGIAAVSLLDPVLAAGVATGGVFVITGLYIAYFHGPRLLLVHLTGVSAVLAILTYRLFSDAVTGIGLAKLVITAAAAIGLAPMVHFMFWLFRTSSVDALMDPLTEVLNRRGLSERLQSLPFHDVPTDHVAVVIVVDLDRFKSINDTLGHAAGDRVLKRTAGYIGSVIRRSAVLARLGGEEFLVVDLVPPDQPAVIGERIRAVIAAPTGDVRVTASVGVASSRVGLFVADAADRGKLLQDLLDRADRALYAAKKNGRDGVVVDGIGAAEST